MDKTKNIRMLADKLKSDRANWETSWQDIADHFLPRADNFISKTTPGQEKEGRFIFDSSPGHSLSVCISGLNALLSNSATKWFGLTTSDKKINKNSSVQKWLQNTQSKMLDVLNQSSFCGDSYDVYEYLVLFGTAALFIGSNKDFDSNESIYNNDGSIVTFNHIPLNELLIRLDAQGNVDCVIRMYSKTVRQLVQMFGEENVSSQVLDGFKSNQDEKEIEILHAVYPRTDTNLGKYKGNLKYVSLYIEKQSGHLLREGGYHEFPYAVPRLFVGPDENWGRGLGWQALPDVKTLYAMVRTTMEGAEKTVNPPITVPSDLIEGKLKLSPRGINYIRSNAGAIQPIYTASQLPFSENLIDKKRLQIAQIFMNDQLQLVGDANMTATEVMQRAEEKMRLIAPVLGKIQNEFLRPVIERTFYILNRHGYFDPMPEDIKEKGIKIEYLSPIARAQRLSEVNAMQRLTELMSPFLSADPRLFQMFNPEEMARIMSDILGVPADVLKSKDEMDQIKEQEIMSQQMMQQAQIMQQATEQSKIASEAELNRSRANII